MLELLSCYEAIYRPDHAAIPPAPPPKPSAAAPSRVVAPPTAPKTPEPERAVSYSGDASLHPDVIAIQNEIAELKSKFAHEKQMNKDICERISAAEAELAGLPTADPNPPRKVLTATAPAVVPIIHTRSKTLLASARALQLEIQGLRARCREMAAQQSSTGDRVNETLRQLPLAAEAERKKDAKAVQRLQELYANEVKLRKQYYNQIQQLKGNVRVFCRVCPGTGGSSVISFHKEDEIIFHDGTVTKNYEFDAVFGPDHDQDDVIQDAKPLIESTLDGHNVCIMAYGASGCGKTHTLIGPDRDAGIARHAMGRLLEMGEERVATETISVELSCFEIDNEGVREVLGATTLKTQEDIASALAKTSRAGAAKTATVILQIVIRSGSNIIGKLSMVDCAASDKSLGPNKSLTALQEVVASLSAGTVPKFANSKLTHFLQDHFVGQAKVLLIVCVSSTQKGTGDAVAALQFGSLTRGVSLVKSNWGSPGKKNR